jgi:hypothetical protein
LAVQCGVTAERVLAHFPLRRSIEPRDGYVRRFDHD